MLALLLAVPTLPVSACAAQDEPAAPAASVITVADLGLTLDFGFLKDLAPDPDEEGGKGRAWIAAFEGSGVRLHLGTVDLSKATCLEPEDVVELARDQIVEASESYGFGFEALRAVRGRYGAAPILALTRSDVTGEGDEVESELHLIGSLAETSGWFLQVQVGPPLAAEPRAKLVKALEGCAQWSGKVRDPKWTDADAKAYFDAHAGEEARKKYTKPVRTEHFLVLSPHGSAAQFGKKLEAWYAEIHKVLPFEEEKDRRLLPVLLFRHDKEFREFYAAQAGLKSETEIDVDFESWCGGAWYATHFDNDNEYDNRRELAKFLLINRVRAWGACAWFRNGLRQYIATRPNEREEAVRAAKKKRATSLEKLFDDKAWDDRADRMSKTGTDGEASYWMQAALWMEFLREGKETKARFNAFVAAMRGVADGDVARVKDVLKTTFGWDVPELERRMADYCQTRK